MTYIHRLREKEQTLYVVLRQFLAFLGYKLQHFWHEWAICGSTNAAGQNCPIFAVTGLRLPFLDKVSILSSMNQHSNEQHWVTKTLVRQFPCRNTWIFCPKTVKI